MNPYEQQSELRWSSFSENEKWKVWWGITWRGFVVSMGFMVITLIFVACLGASLS